MYYYYDLNNPYPWGPTTPQPPMTPIPTEPVTQYGWKCPSCGTVNAPWKPKCDCVPPTVTSKTYTNEDK